MSKFAASTNLSRGSSGALGRWATIAALGASAAIFAVGSSAVAQAPAQERGTAQAKAPDLASARFAWLALGVDWLDPPPGSGRGPIRPDPAHPYQGNRDGPGQVTPHIGNTKDPVLKPWAAKQMRDSNDEVL